MVIELAFAFPGLPGCLDHGIIGAVHGHGHSIVHPGHSVVFRVKRQ
jgi:hypothetical protein